jgi:hypothetical protein
MIGQNNGNDFEWLLIHHTNENTFSKIPPPIQGTFSTIDNQIGGTARLSAEKLGGKGLKKKADIAIRTEKGQEIRISVKKGSGNSVHQESVSDFIHFLNSEGASQSQLEQLLFFHWGDGTLDGSGSVDSRLNAIEIRKKYPKTIIEIDSIFNSCKRAIIERVLLGTGDVSARPTHLLYSSHCELSNIKIAKMEKVVKFHLEIENQTLKVGNLNFQAYQRCLQGQEMTSSKNRNDIQFKWPGLSIDIGQING